VTCSDSIAENARRFPLPASAMIESLLLAVTRVTTHSAGKPPTNATGFFFERDGRLFVVTNRHVVVDEASAHRPERIELELHIDPDNVAEVVAFSVPLHVEGVPVWIEATDAGGTVDVVAIELDREVLGQRIAARAAAMVASGLIDEVRALLTRHPPDCPGLSTLGYREVVAAILSGELDESALTARLTTAHRQYAKRQQTWFARAHADTRLPTRP